MDMEISGTLREAMREMIHPVLQLVRFTQMSHIEVTPLKAAIACIELAHRHGMSISNSLKSYF